MSGFVFGNGAAPAGWGAGKPAGEGQIPEPPDFGGGVVQPPDSVSGRTLADWFSDTINVIAEGAVLDGVTGDDAAFQKARDVAENYGTISVPPGKVTIKYAWPAPVAGTSALWKLSGNFSPSEFLGATGSDVAEDFNGAKWFYRTNNNPDGPPVLRVDQTFGTGGGTLGNVAPTIQANTTLNNVNLSNFAWGIVSLMNCSATGAGQHVAIAGYNTRQGGSGCELWGGNFSAGDHTGNKSSVSGALVGAELDINSNGADDGGAAEGNVPAGQGIRIGCQIALSSYNNVAGNVVGWGSVVGTDANTTVQRGYAITGNVSMAAFSTEYATIATNVGLRMSGGHRISFTADDKFQFSFNTISNSWIFLANGISNTSIDENGNIDCVTVNAGGEANDIGLAGSSAGTPVTITASGSDADIDVEIVPKGTGGLVIGAAGAGAITAKQLGGIQDIYMPGMNYGDGIYLGESTGAPVLTVSYIVPPPAPTATMKNGSLCICPSGAAGTTLYVNVAGAWKSIA